jgi:hypothetical protein
MALVLEESESKMKYYLTAEGVGLKLFVDANERGDLNMPLDSNPIMVATCTECKSHLVTQQDDFDLQGRYWQSICGECEHVSRRYNTKADAVRAWEEVV